MQKFWALGSKFQQDFFDSQGQAAGLTCEAAGVDSIKRNYLLRPPEIQSLIHSRRIHVYRYYQS